MTVALQCEHTKKTTEMKILKGEVYNMCIILSLEVGLGIVTEYTQSMHVYICIACCLL